MGEFCYVSSAYSCGKTCGNIKPDYTNLDQDFRNPYERIKLETEILIRDFCEKRNIRYRIFRPSTFCGRLLEQPQGYINKFDVFYEWAAFFLYLKTKQISNMTELFQAPLHYPVRMCRKKNAGLNIVPVDYAAKIMLQVALQNHPDISFHLCNKGETPHELYVPMMLNLCNVQDHEIVEEMPRDMTRLEKFYYRTVGKIFTPYVCSDPIHFDTSNIITVEKKAGFTCPTIDKECFQKLMEYAKSKYFGLDVSMTSNKD